MIFYRIPKSQLSPSVIYCRFALGGSGFTITIYVGDGPDSDVGSIFNFSTASSQTGLDHGCANCRQQEDSNALATGQVPISIVLLRDLLDPTKELSSLEPDDVAAYLKSHLHWSVRVCHNQLISLS